MFDISMQKFFMKYLFKCESDSIALSYFRTCVFTNQCLFYICIYVLGAKHVFRAKPSYHFFLKKGNY